MGDGKVVVVLPGHVARATDSGIPGHENGAGEERGWGVRVEEG